MHVDDLIEQMGRFHEGFDAKRAKRLAKAFDLDVKAKTGALSTGYRTICQLVLALSLDADYLLLDEPVLGLDAAHRELFYQLLMEDLSLIHILNGFVPPCVKGALEAKFAE